MIKKTELRIGNFLKINTYSKENNAVTGITNECVFFPSGVAVAYEFLIPVSITEEILKELGFVYGRKYCQLNYYDLIAVWKDNDEQVWAFKRNKKTIKYVKYLHEAQNIFYSLESNELGSLTESSF